MSNKIILDADVIAVRDPEGSSRSAPLATLFWGDEVSLVEEQSEHYLVSLPRRVWDETTQHYKDVTVKGLISKSVPLRQTKLLKVRFIDVGQGDGAMVETPSGKFMLIDGGEEEHIRRYINVAFAHLMKNGPLRIDAIVVTHGDADHYAGLTQLALARRNAQGDPMICVERVLHNGLVKGPSSLSESKMFGATATHNGQTYITALHDDILSLDAEQLNRPFQSWQKALQGLKAANGAAPLMKRVSYGDTESLSFLQADGITAQILGPITETVNGADALPFLHTPGSKSLSASHTINGHSAVLRLSYGNVRFLFGADLNEESENSLVSRARTDGISLSSEVLKVPHHGSADFSPAILEAIRPVVSVVSSGDESSAKEYIHPRAGLVGALGKYSRASVERPLIYVTEMVAFFQRVASKEIHNAYQKKSFGIVHVRTDGKRVMVATHSGRDERKESYAFRVDADGSITFEN